LSVGAPSQQTAAVSVFVEDPEALAGHVALARQMGIPTDSYSGLRVGSIGRCNVIVACEIVGAGRRWHLSISHPFRLPTWDEINVARDALIPADVWLCQPMPPREFWINVHARCLHLWEVRDRDLLAQWAYDGCGDSDRADAAVDAFLGEVK
jgi:hypothetical protein